MYLAGVLPWKSSQWIAPPPEEIDRIRAEAGTNDASMAEEGDQVQAQLDRGVDTEQKDSLESGETEGHKE